MSKLLINENPLIVLPSLAVALGSVDTAIFIQQLHYWIADPRAPQREGVRWHYGTFEQWRVQFPWLSLRTLKTIVSKLEEQKLIVSKEFNRMKGDRTKWYTIDYNELSKIEISIPPHIAKLALPSGNNCTTIVQNLHDLYKEEETNKEINKDINTKELITCGDPSSPPAKKIKPDKVTREEIEEEFELFWSNYPNKKGKQEAKERFFRTFMHLDRESAKNLKKEIIEGLIAIMRERAFYEKGAQDFPNDSKLFWQPSWPHGSTWISKKRWVDGKDCKTDYRELLNEIARENPTWKPNRATYAQIFA